MAHLGKNIVIAAALLGAGFAIAWLRFRPWLPDGTELTDGVSIVDTDPGALRFAIFDAPERWPAATDATSPSIAIDSAPAFSADGRYAVFASGLPGERKDLYLVAIENGELGEPELLSKLNTPFDELAPAFSDGQLWFASNRTRPASEGAPSNAERKDFDLYVATFADGRVGDPIALPPSINSPSDERDPAPLADGSGVVFAANPLLGQRRDFDLWFAERAADDPNAWSVKRLDDLCSENEDFEPVLSRDGRVLAFASDRRSGEGGFDLWRSVRDGRGFRFPERITSLASADSERAPRFLDDGFSLLFERRASADPFASPNLLRARSIELFRIPGRPVGWMEILFIAALLLTALLAWLAKRWETLDVLYKCFLVAILVHLFLLWWSQRVPVEAKEVTLPKRDGLFRVQIASASTRAEAKKERGGKLDVARPSAELAASAPARAANLASNAAPAAASPGAMQLARGERATSSPTRSDTRAERSETVNAAAAQIAFADRGPELPRNTTAAPGLDVGGPRATQAARPEVAANGAPSRRAVAPAELAATSDVAPSTLTLERGERSTEIADALETHSRSDATESATRQAPSTSSEVALAADEPTAPTSGDAIAAPELSLADLAPAGFANARESTTSGPSRATIEFAATDSSSGETTAPPSMQPFELAARTDATTPERSTVEFTPDLTNGAPNALAVDLAVDAPREASRAPAGPAIPNDHLALDPVAFDAHPSDAAASALKPQRFDFGIAADAAPAPSPSKLEFARAEPERDAEPPQPTERFEHTPYKTRFGLEKEVALKTHGGSAETERAVAMGLRYLASQQTEQGCFGDVDSYDDKYGYVVIGKSGLCLLAFLGAGHTPASNTEYSAVAARAVKFLADVQVENGHFGWTSAYSHGIATYALAECYALTKDEALRPIIERAVQHILANQSKSRDPRNAGGWGYFNPDGAHFDKWSRVSITAWQVMALESARLGGITVPDAAFEGARKFILAAVDEQYGYIRYSHEPDRLNSEYRTLPGSTPAGLFALSLLGEDVTTADFAPQRRFVMERSPKEYRWRGDDAFVHEAAANLYFWYYGSLALFRIGGESWTQWNDGLKGALLPSQAKDGSWKPIDNYSERAGDTNSSRCFTTAMNVLTLEVYYRYFTPLLNVK
jgi:WD40-like Beta Propeller Repeat